MRNAPRLAVNGAGLTKSVRSDNAQWKYAAFRVVSDKLHGVASKRERQRDRERPWSGACCISAVEQSPYQRVETVTDRPMPACTAAQPAPAISIILYIIQSDVMRVVWPM